MGRNVTSKRAAEAEVVTLPEPAPAEDAYQPRHSSEEDVNMAVKTIDEIVKDLEHAAEVEGSLDFGDEKMDGHRAANLKALQDCIAKLSTVQKRHGWVKAWIEKATKAAEREAAAEKRRAEAKVKADAKAAAQAAKAAEKATK